MILQINLKHDVQNRLLKKAKKKDMTLQDYIAMIIEDDITTKKKHKETADDPS